jgi:acetyltransferase-like isoleucine patch superfamily enzyme
MGDKARVKISKKARIQNAILNTGSGNIEIQDYVFFGYNVSLLTGTHDYYKLGQERITSVPKSGRNIVIKKGAWVASNSIIIGPCTIGENSVINAGLIIQYNIPDNTFVTEDQTKTMRKIINI